MDFEINCKAQNLFRFLSPPVFADLGKIIKENGNWGKTGALRISGNFHLDKLLILFKMKS
jgi:hypothetical protein